MTDLDVAAATDATVAEAVSRGSEVSEDAVAQEGAELIHEGTAVVVAGVTASPTYAATIAALHAAGA